MLLLRKIFPVSGMLGMYLSLYPVRSLGLDPLFLFTFWSWDFLFQWLQLTMYAWTKLASAKAMQDHSGFQFTHIARATYLTRRGSCTPRRPPGASSILFLLHFTPLCASGHLFLCHIQTDPLVKDWGRENNFVSCHMEAKCLSASASCSQAESLALLKCEQPQLWSRYSP